MTADLPKIEWSEQQAELRSRLSSLKWFARLAESNQRFLLELWEKAAPTGVLTKEAFDGNDLKMMVRMDLAKHAVNQRRIDVFVEFNGKFFFTDYIVVTYGTLTLSDPKHYDIYCKLMEHDLDVATMLRYVPMQR